MEFASWHKRAVQIPWWSSEKVLKVATDCSGIGMPEQALLTLAESRGLNVQFAFGSDLMAPCRKWIEAMRPGPVLVDMTARKFGKGSFTTVSNGNSMTFARTALDLDLYVCGFVCSPFTKNGQRRQWQHEHSSTFFASIKTILCLQPRCFVLENVLGISNNTSWQVVEQAFSLLAPRYMIHKVRADAKDFGVPQSRPRIFFIGVRKDMVKPAILEAPEALRQALVERKLAKAQTTAPIYVDFLKECGYPIVQNKLLTDTENLDMQCTCGPHAVCKLHTCKCQKCIQFGSHVKACVWRSSVKTYRIQTRKQRMAYLSLWRKAKTNMKLKSVPDYFHFARRARLHTASVTSPLNRCVLKALSESNDLMNPKTILRLSKTIGRNSLRNDGIVPTLTNGCLNMFVPSAARCLTIPQLLCLSGLAPQEHWQAFELAAEVPGTTMANLIAGTMSLPVIGCVIATTLSLIGT